MGMTIKAARVNANLTRKEAAPRLGISPDTLYLYESGKSSPRVDVVQKMVVLYSVAFEDLNFCEETTV